MLRGLLIGLALVISASVAHADNYCRIEYNNQTGQSFAGEAWTDGDYPDDIQFFGVSNRSGKGTESNPYTFEINDNQDAVIDQDEGQKCQIYVKVTVGDDYNQSFVKGDGNGKKADCSQSNYSTEGFLKTYGCSCDTTKSHGDSKVTIECTGSS